MAKMNRNDLFVSAVLVILSLGSASLRANEPSADDTIRVISYNVQFLPGPARVVNKRKDPFYRAERLGQEMAKFDIAALNETFDDQPREIILAELKKAWGEKYNAIVHPKPNDDRFNGGVLIASRFPILASHTLYYSHFSKKEQYGVLADGFAAKGVVHARIARSKERPDDFIDVFSSHLEARDDSIREFQYPEFADFIREHSDPGHPALLMGDFNTRGFPADQTPADSQYARMTKSFREARPGAELIDLWPALMGGAKGGTSNQETTEKGSRIDFIFLSNPSSPSKRLTPKSVRINPYADPKVIYLSDHSAVEAELLWPR